MLLISEKLSTDSRRMLQNGVPQFVGFCRCTPCRQRRGKVASSANSGVPAAMHPVQAAPRQSRFISKFRRTSSDAPRAGSAEAKRQLAPYRHRTSRCTPCRQRRGKVASSANSGVPAAMHPVQAAPRQSRFISKFRRTSSDAPRAGSAEAKSLHQQIQAYQQRCTPCRQRRGKEEAERRTCNARVMHPVQAAHSEITTCRQMVL